MRVLGDLLDWITRVIDYDLLRGDEDPHRRLESFDVELAVGSFELHQIQRREVASGVVEKEIFAARVGRILPSGTFAGVPLVNRSVELHPGIAADVCALGNFSQ